MTERRLYLLDIEGTVAPLTLTSDVLFPYARRHFASFLEQHIDDPAVRADLVLLSEENRAETTPDVGCAHFGKQFRAPAMIEVRADSDPRQLHHSALAYLLWLMDRDCKSTALKSLQGKIWRAGFESGELVGTLYADVPGALFRWSARAEVAIYSSGSVEAQQLLFRHTNCGDLTSHIGAFFDTRTGPKTAGASYAAIARAIGVDAPEVSFFSDSVPELDAAREAGCQTRLVVRPGNPPVEDAHGHDAVTTLDA